MVGMQIGEVSQLTGLSLRTIRFYEEVGILAPASRTKGGFRLFAQADVDRLLVVRQLKPLNFSVEEMREFLEAADALSDPTRTSVHPSMVRRLGAYRDRVLDRAAAMRERAAAAERFAEQIQVRLGSAPEVGAGSR